jgi:hypothetical protein
METEIFGTAKYIPPDLKVPYDPFEKERYSLDVTCKEILK